MSNKQPLIMYHAGCADGLCAAWVAHRKMPDAEFVPVQYGQEPPDVLGRDVFILDFSYKRPVMERMRESARMLTVLDHHKTAQAELEGFGGQSANTLCRFDLNKSGGRLAWEWFFPGEPASWLVDYTEDRDLWRWKLPRSREISAVIASYPFDFDLWDRWNMSANNWNGTPVVLANEGEAILRYQQRQVDTLCDHASEIDMDGHKVLAVNTPLLQSEIAGKLAEGRPFGAVYFIRDDGKRVWSLRSRDGGVDVSEIAKRHGGGGHRNAAGFEETLAC